MLLKPLVKERWPTGQADKNALTSLVCRVETQSWGQDSSLSLSGTEAMTVRRRLCPWSPCNSWLQSQGGAAGQRARGLCWPPLSLKKWPMHVLGKQPELTAGSCSLSPSTRPQTPLCHLQEAGATCPPGCHHPAWTIFLTLSHAPTPLLHDPQDLASANLECVIYWLKIPHSFPVAWDGELILLTLL